MAVLWGVLNAGRLCADTFTYLNESGETQTVTGLLTGSGQGVHAIEQSDGSVTLIPEQSVRERTVGADPEPLTPREMADHLTEEFGDTGVRTLVRDPYVVGLVLAGPLPEQSEARVTGFLKNAAQFLDRVDTVFSGFCRDLRIETSPPRYPLVMLIFERDRDFNAYTTEATGGRGLSSDRVSGFYSPLSNRLAIRIGECRSFQVPLHEAIHQQVFNRGLLQRLADIPTWFNEGIATGFENNGERINIGPNKVNSIYAKRLNGDRVLDWQEIVTADAAFRGDVLVGEAYAQAWGLHWLLVTEHKSDYARYLKQLGQIEPLQKQPPELRQKLFEETFGTTIAELEEDFPRLLKAAMRRQGVRLNSSSNPGYSLTSGDACEVELTAVQRTSRESLIEVQGRIRNVSPFRDFAFYVTVQTDGGFYTDWFIPCVSRLETAQLPKQFIMKHLPGGPGTEGTTFWVEISSALPDSEEVAAWKRGEYPVPVWNPRN
ncbi:MAG: DUF1570 domain-containing protein [Planctomycetaceae bacterium]